MVSTSAAPVRPLRSPQPTTQGPVYTPHPPTCMMLNIPAPRRAVATLPAHIHRKLSIHITTIIYIHRVLSIVQVFSFRPEILIGTKRVLCLCPSKSFLLWTCDNDLPATIQNIPVLCRCDGHHLGHVHVVRVVTNDSLHILYRDQVCYYNNELVLNAYRVRKYLRKV